MSQNICQKCGRPISEHDGSVGAAKQSAKSAFAPSGNNMTAAPSNRNPSFGNNMTVVAWNTTFEKVPSNTDSQLNAVEFMDYDGKTRWRAFGVYRGMTIMHAVVSAAGVQSEDVVKKWPYASNLFNGDSFSRIGITPVNHPKNVGDAAWLLAALACLGRSDFIEWMRAELGYGH